MSNEVNKRVLRELVYELDDFVDEYNKLVGDRCSNVMIYLCAKDEKTQEDLETVKKLMELYTIKNVTRNDQ